MKSATPLPYINPGKRCCVVGRTGSGKSVQSKWMVKRSPLKWLIVDLKIDEGFNNFRIIEDLPDTNKILKVFEESQWLVLRPPAHQYDYVDGQIHYVHESITNIGLYIDELYMLHHQGQAGVGLTSWLTRGRSRRQSFLGGTQRPAWVSRFVFSESDYLSIFSLNLKEDRKRMYEACGREEVMTNPPRYCQRFYTVATDNLRTYGVIPQ